MAAHRTEGILLAGDGRLRAHNELVRESDLADAHHVIHGEISRLQRALDEFRAQHGFGRAIAAPQIGVNRRMLALVLAGDRFVMFNPRITAVSEDDTFTLWDDCFSLPDVMVLVRRYSSVTVDFQRLAVEESDAASTAQGQAGPAPLLKSCTWHVTDRATSELLQHEIDHLDGVLMTDRAISPPALASAPSPSSPASRPRDNIAYRDVFLANLDAFRDLVDHFPYATTPARV